MKEKKTLIFSILLLLILNFFYVKAHAYNEQKSFTIKKIKNHKISFINFPNFLFKTSNKTIDIQKYKNLFVKNRLNSKNKRAKRKSSKKQIIKKQNNKNKKFLLNQIKNLKREEREIKRKNARKLKNIQKERKQEEKRKLMCKLIDLDIEFIKNKLNEGCRIKTESRLKYKLKKLYLRKETYCDMP